MLYLVCLNGLPVTIRHRQIRKFVKDAKNQNISYWVRFCKTSPDLKKILVEVYSETDAKKLVRLLNGKTYVSHDNITYTCSAFVESTREARLTENPVRQKMQSNNCTVKKNQSKVTDNKLLPETSNDNALLPEPLTLPKFNQSSKKLTVELDGLIKKHCHSQMSTFMRAIRTQIRVRLTQVFEGRDLSKVYSMPMPNILAEYRKAYNKSTDESFVIQTYKMLQVACWPSADTMEDGSYLEELEVENERVLNINRENSDKAMAMNVPEGDYLNKGSIKDEEKQSIS